MNKETRIRSGKKVSDYHQSTTNNIILDEVTKTYRDHTLHKMLNTDFLSSLTQRIDNRIEKNTRRKKSD